MAVFSEGEIPFSAALFEPQDVIASHQRKKQPRGQGQKDGAPESGLQLLELQGQRLALLTEAPLVKRG